MKRQEQARQANPWPDLPPWDIELPAWDLDLPDWKLDLPDWDIKLPPWPDLPDWGADFLALLDNPEQ